MASEDAEEPPAVKKKYQCIYKNEWEKEYVWVEPHPYKLIIITQPVVRFVIGHSVFRYA